MTTKLFSLFRSPDFRERTFSAPRGKWLLPILAILLGALALAGYFSFASPAKAANGSQANTSNLIVEYKGFVSTSIVTAYLQSPANVQAAWYKNGVQVTPHVSNCPTVVPSGTVDVTVRCQIVSPIATDVIRLEISSIAGQTGSISGYGRTTADSTWGVYLSDIISFGNFGITSLKNAFSWSPAAFQVTATLPSSVTDLSSAFNASSANPDLSGWNTSAVTNMSTMFFGAANFNQNISGWNTGAVTGMSSMFRSATTFNQDISGWNTSSVINMNSMFKLARAFNQNISGWNTSAATSMISMFEGASAFNQELTSWNVANVTDMSYMFSEATLFNNGNTPQTGAVSSVVAGTRPLAWTTTSLTNTAYMFRGAKAFNQNINSWDVSKVTNFTRMFSGADTSATVTNGLDINDSNIFFNNGGANDISNGVPGAAALWPTNPPGSGTGTAAIDMSFMFSGSSFFNQDINSWNTGYVTTMQQMFESATGFNNGDQKYSVDNAGSHDMTLSVGRVTNFTGMFFNASSFNQKLNSWDVSAATSLRYMFANNRANNTAVACNCTWFNNGSGTTATTNNTMTWLSSGSTAATVDMALMFFNNPYFNQDITGWGVGKVTHFSEMFNAAIGFNNGQGSGSAGTKPLTWSTSSATAMNSMFYGAVKFNQNIDNWDTSKVTNFSSMFTSATTFNNGLTSGTPGTMVWRANAGVSSLMGNMFNSASSFNQNVSAWNTSAVTTMHYMFSNATKFNNGQPTATAGGSDLTFSTANVTSMASMFASAAVFNQNVSSFDTSKVTTLQLMFSNANAFNNGQAPGGAGQNPISWNTGNVQTIAGMFQSAGAYVFNQNVSGWNLGKCTDYGGAFAGTWPTFTNAFNNGALPGETNTLSWTINNTASTATSVSMYQMFQGLRYFNADITGWDVSRVSNLGNAFYGDGAFNQNIGNWNTGRVTTFVNTFRNTIAFNQDISGWDVNKATTLGGMFDNAAAFNQNLANWQLSSLGNSGLTGIFGSSVSTAMSAANLETTTIAWSHQTARSGFPTTGTYDAFGKARWLNCVGYAGYVRMNAKQAMTTWATLGSAPTGCQTATVSWYGASTGVTTTQTIPAATVNFTPAAASSSSGTAPRFVVLERGLSLCRVNNVTGVISYTTAGTCTVRAYDTASLSNGDVTTYKDVTFTLPTPSVATAPTAPTITSVTSTSSGALSVAFTAPTSNGGSAITSYKYSINGGSTWVTASGLTSPITITGLTSGQVYSVQLVAVNIAGTSAAATAPNSVSVVGLPDSPIITTVTPGSTSLSIGFLNPSSDGGSPITSYKYRLAANTNGLASATWVTASGTSSPISITGLTSGNTYVVELIAVTAIGESATSSISSPVTLLQAPGAPEVRLALISGSSAQVVFVPPTSDGGSAITLYEYRYKYATKLAPASFDVTDASWSSINSAVWSSWATTPALTDTTSGVDAAKSFNITGLPLYPVGGLWLVVEVRAVNIVGTGPISVQRPNTVDVSFPTDGTEAGDGFITFIYHLTYGGNSPITRFEYMLYTANSGWSAWSDMGRTTDTSPYTVTGLSNGQAYSVRVRAINAYGSIEGQTSFSVNAISVTPNKPMPTGSLAYTAVTYSPTLTASPSTATRSGDGAISYRSQYTTICTVDNSGTVTVLTAGNCLIYMDVAEGTTTGAKTFSAWLMISKAAQSSLAWNVPSTSGAYLSTITLDVTGGTGTGLVTYAKSVASNCSLVGNIVTLGTVGGTCSISATKAADTNYLSTSTSTNLTLTSTQTTQSAVSFSNASSMRAGQTITLQATGGSGTGTYTYSVSSQGTTGCTLTGAVLSAPTAGTCVVSVTRSSSTNYVASTAVTQSITVDPETQTVQFTSVVPQQPLAGSTYTPAASSTSGLAVAFSVSGTCSISSGVVTFSSLGTCQILADQAGNATYSAAPQATQSIAVGLRNQALDFTAATDAISTKTFGDLAFLVEATSNESSAVVTYALSTNTTNSACSVSSSGLVTILAVGICAIDADSAGTSAFASASRITKTISVVSDLAGAPSIGSVSGGNLSATLGFYAPGYDGGSAITAYQVVAIDQTPGSNIQVTESGCSTVATNGLIRCRVTGLQNGVVYKLKVAPINAAGLGAYSTLSGNVTVATNPSAVQNLAVLEGNSALTISWTSPDSLGGGTFSAYRIFIKRSDALTYDQDHFFNVTSQSTTSVSVTRESPTDGMTFAGGPLLQNGVGYDVKVVTVTTANLLELESNTAVVNQIPHTVPDAPAVATSVVVGNQLIITWSTPISDGGKPVSAYTVSIANSTCSLVNPTDLQCSVALPTAPGNYTFEVRAVNAAGTSEATTVLFHVASAAPVSSGGSNSNPVTPAPQLAPEVKSISLSTDGKQANILGSNFKKIQSLTFGNAPAAIVSADGNAVVASSNGLKPGTYDMLITFVDGTTLRIEKALVIAGTPVVTTKPLVFSLPGFKQGTSALTKVQKVAIVKFLKSAKNVVSVECVGSTQGPTILNADAKLAMKRGSVVCAVAKAAGFKIKSVSYVNRLQVGAKYRSVEVRLNRTR